MVRESEGKQGATGGKGTPLATTAFLALCPDVSGIVSLRTAVSSTSKLAYGTASAVEKYPAAFLVPWLWLLRFLARQGAVLLLLFVFLFGLGVLAALDSLLQEHAVAGAKPARLHSREVYAGDTSQKPLVPGVANPVLVCGSASMDAAQLTKPAQAVLAPVKTSSAAAVAPASPRAPAPASSGGAVQSTPTQAQMQRLVANVQALHRQVYGKELAPLQWSQDLVASTVAKMCKELGHEYRPELCSSYDALLAKIHELRHTVGIS